MMNLVAKTAFVCASLASLHARAEETEVSFAYLPAPNAEALAVEQKMGRLELRGWDKPEVRIVARKRATTSGVLDRLKVNVEMQDGRIRIRTGVHVDGGFRPLPLGADMGIDLTIDAPRQVALKAATWTGDLSVSGFRSGAELASSGGEVRASDIQGRVSTHALSGRQRLSSIRGDVVAEGEHGDLDLDTVDGDLLDARVVEGQISARAVRTPVVRLFSTLGGIVMVGMLRSGGRYDLNAGDGDIRLTLTEAPFTVHARAGKVVKSGFRLVGQVAPAQVQADHLGGGPLLELTSARGSVFLDRLANPR